LGESPERDPDNTLDESLLGRYLLLYRQVGSEELTSAVFQMFHRGTRSDVGLPVISGRNSLLFLCLCWFEDLAKCLRGPKKPEKEVWPIAIMGSFIIACCCIIAVAVVSRDFLAPRCTFSYPMPHGRNSLRLRAHYAYGY